MTLSRWGALFGILAALLLVGAVLASGDTPDGDSPDADWVDYIKGDESTVLLRAYMLVAASLSLVAFYSLGVRPRLGAADAADNALAHVGAGATVLAGASFAAAGLVGAAVGAANKFGDVPIDPAIARLFDNWLYGFLLVSGAVPMGVLMAVVAIQTRRRKAFSQWVLWVSLVGILGMAASLIFLPFVLLPIWLIAISVAIFQGGEPAA